MALVCALVHQPSTALGQAANAGAMPVNQPDVRGGYESAYIIIRIRTGTVPVKLSDGRWTIRKNADAANATLDAESKAIAATFKRHNVSGIAPLFPGPHINPQRAAELGLDRWYKVSVPRGSHSPAIAAEVLRASARFEIAQADDIGGIAVVPNDTYFGNQYALHNTGQNGGTPDADCDATDLWDLYQGDASAVLAIIDTGIQHFDSNIAGSSDHPDLVGGRIISGWNTRDENADTTDIHGHGTHCSGIAGARGNNGVGVAGLNWNVTLMAMRVADQFGNANQTDVAEAVVFAVNNGADVVSMSLQFYGSVNMALRDAVAYAYDSGVLPVAATGNFQSPGTIAYPAKYAKCMGVGATTRFDGHAGFSNNGPEIDLAAPGADIFGLWKDSNYTFGFPEAPVGPQNGTSMATPLVSGLAAMMKSRNPSLTPAQIEHLLKVTCEDQGAAGWDSLFGWGRINAHQAIIAATRPADLNRNGMVNIDDLVLLITQWGPCPPPTASLCVPDITANGTVDIDDLVKVVTDWG